MMTALPLVSLDDELSPRERDLVMADPFYRAAWDACRSRASLVEAGFFDDGLAERPLDLPSASPAWLGTPFNKLGNGDVVLLCTGSFAPVHNGHLEMMERAKACLEAAGHRVAGGYLSPSHDAYVSTKYGGAAAVPAEIRIDLCRRAVEGSDWIMVDPWEARDVPVPLNFTDVLRRLERVLSAWTRRRIQVAYVFGGDNAAFARAFLAEGLAVCVGRNGHEARMNLVSAEIGRNGRIFFLPAADGGRHSSMSVRAGTAEAVPVAARSAWASWLSGAPATNGVYQIRDDGPQTVSAWLAGRDAASVLAALAVLKSEIADTLETALGARCVRLEILDAGAQIAAAEADVGADPSISLDVHFPGRHRIDVSRVFALAEGQFACTGVANRPGTPSLSAQATSIPAGRYVLVEDDIASGRTMAAVRALLRPDITIEREIVLARYGAAATPGMVLDIVDLRDFIVGARHGGLVVDLPDGTHARAPYMPPFVSLPSRAMIPTHAERDAGIRLWAANTAFFAAIVPAIRIRDADPAFAALARTGGFAEDETLEAYCRWHLMRLQDASTR